MPFRNVKDIFIPSVEHAKILSRCTVVNGTWNSLMSLLTVLLTRGNTLGRGVDSEHAGGGVVGDKSFRPLGTQV